MFEHMIFWLTFTLSAGTFKLRKVELQKEGYNLPRLVTPDGPHTLFFLDSKNGEYIPLSSSLLQDIADQKTGL